MDKIYVILGSWGEYSDHSEWVVGYYLDEAKAIEHVERANKYSGEATELRKVQREEGAALRVTIEAEYGPALVYPSNSFQSPLDGPYGALIYGGGGGFFGRRPTVEEFAKMSGAQDYLSLPASKDGLMVKVERVLAA